MESKMYDVPHDLIINVNAELELEEKARRIARLMFPKGFSEHIPHAFTSGLKLAHSSLHGKSNLTAWRITREWSDMYAVCMLRNLLCDEAPTITPRLRAWERHKN